MKILVNTPDLKLLGGVSNHYLGLRPFWTEIVKYNTVGRRGKISGKYLLIYDLVKFIWRLIIFRPDVVILNPSIAYNSLRRDFIFLKIAVFFKIKVTVFIHGFNWDVAKSIDHKWIVNNLNLTSLILILAESFKIELIKWGVTSPIHITTTKVDDRLIRDFNIDSRDGRGNNLLFVSRVEKSKGIYETIETFRILKKQFSELTLTIVGNGSELQNVKKYVSDTKIPDVLITGVLTGDGLIQSFNNALLLLLTSYSEGMPTVVLEGMAFGLPIITRNVGGIPDFFENGRMGFMTDSFSPQVFAASISEYLNDRDKLRQTAQYNHKYALEHFMASNVALNIENIIKKYCLQ